MEAGRDALQPEPAPPPTITSSRDWAELPVDALLFIVTKLDIFDILMRAGLVCHCWLDAARVPSLWRCMDMASPCSFRFGEIEALRAMAKLAVDRSGGQLQEFSGRRFVTAEVLNYIGDRAPSLKTLRLVYCCMDNERFVEAIKKFPLLEELELALCNTCSRVSYEAISKACPHLKSFKEILGYSTYFVIDPYDVEVYEYDGITLEDQNPIHGDDQAMGIATMSGLHTLKLFGSDLTNKGLTAILDRCTHLVSLDVRQCFYLKIDAAMEARLTSLRTLRLPGDPTDDFDELVKSPDCSDHGTDSYSDGYFYGRPYHFTSPYSDEYEDYCDFEEYF